jgi:NDP-sugar pyrophosphorylase family protein
MPDMPDAIVLCGGAGVRLREITGNAPKPMARIGRRPFLEILLRQLRRNRFERVILAVGYGQEVIRSHFGKEFLGLKLLYSPEGSPLGTGGAVRNAAECVEADAALVMNGDSYIDADLGAFMAYHRASRADVSLIVAPIDGRADCGAVHVAKDGALAGFTEKQGSSAAPYLNAGVYVISRRILYDIPAGVQVSLETELFPRWLAEGRSMRAFIWPGRCMDIGTPERFRSAQLSLAAVERQTGLDQSQNLL